MQTKEISVDLVKHVARVIAKAQGEKWSEVDRATRQKYRRVTRQALIAEQKFIGENPE